ncbi:hypothetical protein Kpol_1051p2 [Vanderwaltozyma polyspora DSM 70294]|uniref:Mitochondrial 15S rRNA processing factor CCM1 n=1 Tax=Vanderwaltozyma polyspora (strain ATCC 22028 / DSM 70294 / BCRC 21397 / CBS 2163 / NBRC 10782 / NRRL Y-8283 / UCD 57-17) TaxID=436907 RepID=CCM1_VANPO|nr:uncharacterized protein Kpol_1051p2 [Vanderwaltozyma polyspora DSM 70294]A7TMW6.1 RecName: Full=Mitochondrial group I intron splicing factor CCM1; Flags: Precursor [Vanderwaltozyma polyspora DSM 70294]EDO16354.1 hypothetical protein Kpol_1051p2 [Vanderwaltozyma polyspora DSM 70294]
MLRYTRNYRLHNVASSLILKRTAIIPSLQGLRRGNFSQDDTTNLNNKKRRKRKVTSISLDDLNSVNLKKVNTKELEFKVRQLKEFTKNLKAQIKRSESRNEKRETEDDIDLEEINKDADSVFENLSNHERRKNHKVQNHLGIPIGNSQNQSTNLSSLILGSSLEQAQKFLPSTLVTRLNDNNLVLKCLTDKTRQNWNPIIKSISKNREGLNGIGKNKLNSTLLSSVKGLYFDNIERLDKMLLEYVDNDITKFTTEMYLSLFENLSNIKLTDPNMSNEVIVKMKELLERYDEALIKGTDTKMTQYILNNGIKFASKLNNHEHMEYFLTKFKGYGIIPNRINYTTVLQYYIRMGISKKSWDIFDTMKFLSKEHAPDLIAYNSVLTLCSRDKDYSKALDIYNEMVNSGINPGTSTRTIMAKILAIASRDSFTSEGKSESLRLLGWKFIHEIIETTGSKLSHKSLESMIALAAYDGDVGMSRALYHCYVTTKYRNVVQNWVGKRDYVKIWKSVLDPRMLNYLFLAYSNYNSNKLPLLLGYEQGILLRRNIINSVDYSGRSEFDDDLGVLLPFLPVTEIKHNWELLAESRAIWHFNLEYGGSTSLRSTSESIVDKSTIMTAVENSKTIDDFKWNIFSKIHELKSQTINTDVLNSIVLNTYLTIPIKLHDKKEFVLRLKEFTFQQHDFDSKIESFYLESNNKMVEDNDKNSSSPSTSEDTSIELAEDPNDLLAHYILSLKHKILANCSTYELTMKAASKFNDIKLATEAWEERGKFRKSSSFQKLAQNNRMESDTKFAELMVAFFSSQKMYTDALHVVMSSKRYIDWKYPMVKNLHRGLLEIEDSRSIDILLDIVNRKSKVQTIEETISSLTL